ncbi:MAG: hypothetical protein GKR94_10405 [Gammaproteobacteria bacterium]|nr:hypothetical protein [Gammaproteobacteria bacterium]
MSTVHKLLAGAIALQTVTLIGMVAHSALPLLIGEEVRVKTIPYDPRSLLRGNYARLNYAFSRVTLPAQRLRQGEVVYTTLTLGENGLYQFKEASLEKPADGVFLRGRTNRRSAPRGWARTHRIRYGIEAYFAPKEKALALEHDLRRGGIAVLMVTKDGRAALKDVIANTN